MNIYIPKHIRAIGVVDKMCKLIEGYSEYQPDTEGAFENYYYYLKSDPVIRFLNICIPESEFIKDHPSEEYESVIAYISRLFYSVKGTYKVFDFMKKYLGLEIYDIKYTVKFLGFTIKEITLVDIDENIYYQALLDFLKALLYFMDSKIKIDVINLWLSNTLRNYIGANIVTYKEYTTVNYDSQKLMQQNQ